MLYHKWFSIVCILGTCLCARMSAQETLKQSPLHEIDRAINDAIHSGDINAYLQNNKDFHFGIYELADSPVLMRIAQSLWLQVGPSLRFVCGRYGTANLPDKHADILGALLNQNTELAASAMREDLEQGVMLVTEPSAAIFDQNYSKSQ